jgi:hypothetical protein
MDELIAFLKPENMPLKQAASMGAGILVSHPIHKASTATE